MAERIIQLEESDTMTAMALMLYALPRPATEVDALVVFPGLGERWRMEHALQVWHNPATQARFFLYAGQNRAQRNYTDVSMQALTEQFSVTKKEGMHIRDHAEHTKDQAEWIVGLLQEKNIASLALFVSPHHCLRAYLTLLAACIKASVRIAMLPMPTPIAPSTPIPETEHTAWDMVAGEIARIRHYGETGDVANYEQLREYIDWLWNQPLLKTSP